MRGARHPMGPLPSSRPGSRHRIPFPPFRPLERDCLMSSHVHDPFGARDTFETGAGKAVIYRLQRLEQTGLGEVTTLDFGSLWTGTLSFDPVLIMGIDSVAAIDGDFNEDGVTRGGDFLAWQRGESPDPLSAADLAEWQLDFTASMGIAGALQRVAVPEPTAPTLMIVGLLMLRLARRHRAICG